MKRVFACWQPFLPWPCCVAQAADSTKITGWISDSMCGAKHVGTGAECVKKCIQGGMKPVFVDEAKKQVWSIDNPDSVKGFYGDHVTVTATADAANKSVHIDVDCQRKVGPSGISEHKGTRHSGAISGSVVSIPLARLGFMRRLRGRNRLEATGKPMARAIWNGKVIAESDQTRKWTGMSIFPNPA